MCIVVVVCQLTGLVAFAAGPDLPAYYGREFYSGYQSGSLRNQPLIDSLQKILATNHTSLGYDRARKNLFGKMYLEQISGAYIVKDVYCERSFTNSEVGVGPDRIPDGNKLNTEHTWPQSRFTNRFSKEQQKSDLHHLYPTDNEMNNRRAALRFGYVQNDVEELKCPIARLGTSENGDLVFEVPMHQRGNSARAIFYFATRYQMKISPDEERDLRQWVQQDPVDEEEAVHNDEIQRLQGNRNPYIDFPDLIDRIEHF
jgi:endonuclease I